MLSLKKMKNIIFSILKAQSGFIGYAGGSAFFTYSYLDLDNVTTCVVLDITYHPTYWRCDWSESAGQK